MQSPERLIGSEFSIAPTVYTTTATGTAVDLTSARYAVIVPVVGAITSATVELKVQESADGSTGWVDVPGATQTISLQNAAQALGLVRMHDRERYLRLFGTVTGTNAAFGALLLPFDFQYPADFTPPFAYSI